MMGPPRRTQRFLRNVKYMLTTDRSLSILSIAHTSPTAVFERPDPSHTGPYYWRWIRVMGGYMVGLEPPQLPHSVPGQILELLASAFGVCLLAVLIALDLWPLLCPEQLARTVPSPYAARSLCLHSPFLSSPAFCDAARDCCRVFFHAFCHAFPTHNLLL